MPRSVPAAVLLLVAALLAGCGGGSKGPATLDLSDTDAAATTAAPPDTAISEAATSTESEAPTSAEETATDDGGASEPPGTDDPSTVTVDPDPFPEVDTDDAARPPFPAPDTAGVVALAMQRPAGRVVYDVAFPQGSYVLTMANDGQRAIIHQAQDTGEVWIGADVADGTIAFFCTAPAGGVADCREGDPDGNAIAAAREIAQVVGADFIQSTFGPLAAVPTVGLGQDEQVGRTVSCMATTLEGQDLRLCATEEGFVTQITAGSTSAIAREVSDEVEPVDLEPPSEPQAAG
jgi:hypothetical protein